MFGDGLINDMIIFDVNQSTEIMNEFLSAAIQRDTSETGYDKFHLIDFYGLETPLEESVVQRVIKKLTNVKDFKVATMDKLNTEVHAQFVDFAVDVLEQHESQMTDIDFERLINNRRVSESDQRLVEALCNSGETALNSLNLRSNESWWCDSTLS